MNSLSLLLLTVALVCSASANNWTVVDPDYATIGLACRFQSESNGWVVGSSGSMQPLFLYTTDGAKTFNNSGMAGAQHGIPSSLDMANSQYGIAGAIGPLDLPCGAYMTNGQTWQKTHNGRDIFCQALDSVNVDGGQTMIIVGQWFEISDPNGDGVQISTDAGVTWKSGNWNQGSQVEARYAWFATANQGYVVGGSWPETATEKPARVSKSEPLPINRHITYNRKNFEFKRRERTVDAAEVTGYTAVLAAASNNGKTYNTLINMTNQGVYFNQISCTDAQNCWAAVEGVNRTNGYDAAYIYQTSNGWKTWSTQLYVEGGSLVAITMLNATFGWAGGALVQETASRTFEDSRASYYGQFYITTDGKTWTLNQELKNFYVFDFSVVDVNTAYASGLTAAGLASLAKYS